MELLNQVTQFVISGLATGSIYALIGLSFAIIFNSTGIINFAQGEFVMLGGVLTIFSLNVLQLPLAAAIVVAVAVTTVIGILFERLAIRPLKNATPLALIIITIGMSILIRGLVMLLWGKDTQALPAFSGTDPITVAGATLLPQHLWIFGVTVMVIVGCRLFFNHTISGKAMRACSFNRRAANLVGISVGRMVLFSFVISAAVGSLAGVIIAPLTMTAYDVGVMLGLKGFCAAIMGGMGSGLGTVLGGLILGTLESLGAGLISSGYKDAIAFFILLLILFIRPQGLFKKGETERV
ncbi:branched-chain amino acid ABC transporter permease [Geomonas terrae]|uniref:Branched-chain amino acid ABC transporter permease n=1 Tax=Geomonas terrae TaxID=2562681 RepID=A0A4S1CFX3_9BACT|nr:branched-chain amino acid ABC transporter permease [Geomonas terrae]TGU72458.1 branched-chain amino acid ABC transporter permease [Geomonas terrae]